MDSAIALAREGLGSIPAETRKRHIHSLIEKAKKDIAVEYVLCNKKDAPFVSGYKIEEVMIAGGIIAENKERTMRVDLSYNTLFSLVVDEHLSDVHEVLFEKGGAGNSEKEPLNLAQDNDAKAPKQKRVKK
jgi:vacuolar-type H+-ATPase subunit E/Vma4